MIEEYDVGICNLFVYKNFLSIQISFSVVAIIQVTVSTKCWKRSSRLYSTFESTIMLLAKRSVFLILTISDFRGVHRGGGGGGGG